MSVWIVPVFAPCVKLSRAALLGALVLLAIAIGAKGAIGSATGGVTALVVLGCAWSIVLGFLAILRCLGGHEPPVPTDQRKWLTSASDPLGVDFLADGTLARGRLAMCMLPGRCKGKHQRALPEDLVRLRGLGVGVLVSLVEPRELKMSDGTP